VFGTPPAGAWAAPGRVNLIGEHTDYNDGFVLPFALPQRVEVAVSPVDTPEWTVWSELAREAVGFDPAGLVPGRVSGWAGYAAGVVWALREAGHDVPGARLAVTSDLPAGAGLSSSAALACAVLTALADLAGLDLPLPDRPALARRAETGYLGVPCGIMDQSASLLCRAGHALLLDCRSGMVDQVPLDPAAAGLALLLIDTRTPRQLATGGYATRRAECRQAAAALGVRALRDVPVAGLPAALAALAALAPTVPTATGALGDDPTATGALGDDPPGDDPPGDDPPGDDPAGASPPSAGRPASSAAAYESCSIRATAPSTPAGPKGHSTHHIDDFSGDAGTRTPPAAPAGPAGPMGRRVRHVVTENQRVLETVALLRAGRTREIGPLLSASHASLREDFEVTVPELDLAAEAAETAGALGARMTGGGFGGAVVALVEADRVATVAEAVSRAFARRGYPSPRSATAAPSPSAIRVA
jgi:galactokinase